MSGEAEKLGRVISSALGAGPSRPSIASGRVRVVDAMRAAVAPRFAARLAFGGLAVAMAAGLMFWVNRPQELSGTFRGALVSEAQAVEAPKASESLEFSDGSRIMLSSARVELSELRPLQARVELRRGHVEARIKKNTGRTWTIGAGPYSVRVVGTEFSVDWDGESKALAVAVHEGKVRVFGGNLPAEGVLLGAGGRLDRVARPESAAVPPSPEPARAIERTGPVEPAEPVAAAPTREPAVAGRSAAEPSWQKLADAGKYGQALKVAERAGFENLLTELSENDLLLLANTARYAGGTSRARVALVTLRKRFAGGPGASLSALYLAGLSEDRDRNSSEAASWLRVFLNESPRGELSAGARARLFGILSRQGKRVEAKAVAAEYLRQSPKGPHASEARAVIAAAAAP